MSVTQQLLQLIACLVRSELFFSGCDKDALGHLKPLAVVGQMFLLDRISPAVATFIGNRWIVAGAVKANFEIRATIAGFRAAWRATLFVFRAALPAMSCRHTHAPILQRSLKAPSFHL